MKSLLSSSGAVGARLARGELCAPAAPSFDAQPRRLTHQAHFPERPGSIAADAGNSVCECVNSRVPLYGRSGANGGVA
jgi:hypothetical protein